MDYINYNANPYFNYTDDCAIRAISKCENISWEQAYENLFKISLKLKEIFSNYKVVRIYLKNNYEAFMADIKLQDFNFDVGKKYLLLLKNIKNKINSHHLIFFENGKYYDNGELGKNWVVVEYFILKQNKLEE